MKIHQLLPVIMLAFVPVSSSAQDADPVPPLKHAVDPEQWVDSVLLGDVGMPGPEDEAPAGTAVTGHLPGNASKAKYGSDGSGVGDAADARYSRLTEQDYIEVARELGVEPAAIKAVVDIEAGRAHQGFWAPGKPIINFDLTMYRRAARKHGVNLAKAQRTSPVIFSGPNARKYGSQQAGQQARLDAARAIHEESAIEGTFWGMFQIGGFNWRKLGFSSAAEMAEAMSKSEREQLEIFARFIREFNMLNDLRNKNWLGFALKYNGPRAKSRGYHTKMAAAYARHKKS